VSHTFTSHSNGSRRAWGLHHTADPRSLNRIQKAFLICLDVIAAELPTWHAYSIFMSTCSVPSSWPSSRFRPSNRRVRVSSQFLSPRPFLNIPTVPIRVTEEGHWLTQLTPSASNGHSHPNGCLLRHRRLIRDTKYRHVFATHSVTRTSCLSQDAETSPSFVGFRNLMILVLIVSNLRLMIVNLQKVCFGLLNYRSYANSNSMASSSASAATTTAAPTSSPVCSSTSLSQPTSSSPT
jgi:hypothetical protein